MTPLKFFLYYYGTVLSMILVDEFQYYISNRCFYNPLHMPQQIVFNMALAFLLLLGGYVFYTFIWLDYKGENNIK